ncbi:MAG TPA: hypothetical protein PLP61_14070 [Nocardioides sp.]|uniref:hypothetical protein n=1 Tax=Nocardioides sp. TaxID=35761 RepID=UPI002B73126D|nr:hypothetical protein [Nocardioides sp.]HQR28162.1 hypothetical protein [Nocardioides sp.]
MRHAERAGLVAVVVPFLVAAGLGHADRGGADVMLRFADPAIVESSGLVLTDGLVVTTNDSGDTGRVFVVDPATGRTVGTTTWSSSPVDVEALAPAVGPRSGGEVWVGDIGDNRAARDDVTLALVPVGRSTTTVGAPTYRLTYPDGPHDAEALLVHPVTGRVYLATKGVFGGTLLAAPRRLSAERPNRLRPVGPVPGMVTDGAFLPDGRHLVLRTYTRAVVCSFPGLDPVASFPLPDQPQGEGLAVAPDGSLWLSTEGMHTPVLRAELPARVRAAPAGGPPASSTTSPAASPAPLPAGAREAQEDGGRTWAGAAVLAALAVLGSGAVLARRRRRTR